MNKIILFVTTWLMIGCSGSAVIVLGENKFKTRCKNIFPSVCEEEAQKHCMDKGYEKIDSEVKMEASTRMVGGEVSRDFEQFLHLTFKCQNSNN